MQLSKLTKYLTDASIVRPGNAEIAGITYDSREVKPGWLFIAIKGGSFDGHNFINSAIESGAAAVLAERPIEDINVPCVVAPDGRKAMGEIAAPFFDYPTRKLKLIGVTGTSGKTTVTHLVQSIFNANGQLTGLIGTLGSRIGGELIETKHTTPESVDLQRTFADMLERGATAACIEASSHGLYQGRTAGCEFDCGIFTNIARDHLDFHCTVENYLDAKLILFRDYPAKSQKPFVAVVNADDPAAGQVISASPKAITFAVDSDADVKASNIRITDRSVRFDMAYSGQSVPILLNIGGYFNVYNALAAGSAALAMGLDLAAAAAGLLAACQVPGRFEFVDCGQDFGVIVDYAHTPDELENVLRTAKELTSKRLIVTFGCGGDRDTGKRPIMGKIAADLADVLVVTSDNPRSEDPESIIADIMAGIHEQDRGRAIIRPDRGEGIREAIMCAEQGDVVVIAGKGHEDYQIFANRTIHFDDREAAREVLGCSRSQPEK